MGDQPFSTAPRQHWKQRMNRSDAAAIDWNARADAVFPGGLIGRAGLPRELRFTPVRGQGARLYDRDGRSYVDYLAGAGALVLGHAHPRVTKAIVEQAPLGTIWFGLPSEAPITLAEQIAAAMPGAEKVVLTTTGSEATQYAIRFARAYMRRDLVLKFEGGYHGNHDSVQVSTSRSAPERHPRGLIDSLGVPQPIAESMLVAPYNDADAVRAIVREHRQRIAAIIIDPIQRGGVFPLPGFLAALRDIADEFGVLLIFDEVITGFRLAYGGAQEYFGVKADLAAYGKIIGGGLALGAIAGPARILDLADTNVERADGYVLVNGTTHGAPVAAAAGLATLAELRTPHFYRTLNEWTATLRREVAARLHRHGVPAMVTGEGSFWHVAFTDRPHRNNADSLRADHARIIEFDCELIRNGVHLIPGGRRLATAAHGDLELEDTLRAVDAACRRVVRAG
jgi:glutamate-1-semialdehyde 2,1-aminomutase